MSERNIFELASRQKLRFQAAGNLTAEDLWDLPLQSKTGRLSLDSIAIALDKEIKETGEQSFVTEKPVGNATLELKLDIVKHVIGVKKEEAAQQAKAAEIRSKKEELKALIHQKKQQELSEKGVEELEKLFNELG